MINRFCIGVFLLEVGVNKKKKIVLVLICVMLFSPLKIEAARGCCSHHWGVSGCSSSGRQICKDGTLSPTCTCTVAVTYVYGCTDKTAKNYDANANEENNTCEYYVYGCTDEAAKNYSSEAEKDDGTCEYYVYGCTNLLAENYNSEADKDNGSCILPIDNELDKNDNSSNQEITDDSVLLDTIIGIGIISGGVYLYKKWKQK